MAENYFDFFDDQDVFEEDYNNEQFLKEEKQSYLSWQQAKDELNDWGYKFSSSEKPSERVIAVENIWRILDKIIIRYDYSKNKSDYNRALTNMQTNFKGSTSKPIRFLKHIYPEEAFYNAVNNTLGYGISSKGNRLNSLYDHTKNTLYTTHLSNIVHNYMLDYIDELNSDYTRTNSTVLEYAALSKEKEESVEEAVEQAEAFSFASIDIMVKLADITVLAGKYQEHLGQDKKNKNGVNAKDLEFFYSLMLINFSRWYKNGVEPYENKILMVAIHREFVLFATTINQNDLLNYLNLVEADFSSYVRERNYVKKEGDTERLLNKAVEDFRKQSKSTVSEQFTKIRKYLLPHFKNFC